MSLDVYLRVPHSTEEISFNVTHNLNSMAKVCGLYECLWRPEEVNITKAYQMSNLLFIGIKKLVNNREKYEAYNPPNGWGDYDYFVEFCIFYLAATLKHPNAIIEVSR